MSSEGDQIVAGSRSSSQLLLNKSEHERHGHGAGAVGNDDQDTLALDLQFIGGVAHNLANFVRRERSIRESAASNHLFCFPACVLQEY